MTLLRILARRTARSALNNILDSCLICLTYVCNFVGDLFGFGCICSTSVDCLIGAMADPIRHAENGHRVPAGDASALAAVLEQLSADHPSPQPLLAFSGDRLPLHQELDQLYRSLLS